MSNYLQHAFKDIGLKEIKGDKHNPRIIDAFAKIGHKWLNTDEYAWCAAIVGLWFVELNLPIPKNAFRAFSWKDYGEKAELELGAIVVLNRQGGGHVGLLTGISKDGTSIRLLGVNQGDAVCEAWFKINGTRRIEAVRKPVGYKLKPCPVAIPGQYSVSEA